MGSFNFILYLRSIKSEELGRKIWLKITGSSTGDTVHWICYDSKF